MDWTWNNEILLRNDDVWYWIIYTDEWNINTLRVIKPIFKTDKKLFKFLKDSNWN